MDPGNPVVKLCVQGMQAEAEDRLDDALQLFTQAWQASTDDYEACIAAHFLARQQDDPQETLRWNQEALQRAEAVGDERVSGFYPSLYLNLGFSYELLGDLEQANRCYELAAGRIGDLPDGQYTEVVKDGIARGRRRVSEMSRS